LICETGMAKGPEEAMTVRSFVTPTEGGLGLKTIANGSGLTVSVLPNGALYAIESRGERGRTLINQVLGHPIHGGIGRILLRPAGGAWVTLVGPEAEVSLGFGERCVTWSGECADFGFGVMLLLHEEEATWVWRVEIENASQSDLACDVVLVQDVGLADRGFVMGSEAYTSQYVDHHVETHPVFGPIVMSRQNQAQGGRFPWLATGCVDGAASFATDALQFLGCEFRATGHPDPGRDLPGRRLQHELACPMIQARPLALRQGGISRVSFFGHFVADHPAASGGADLDRLGSIAKLSGITGEPVATAPARRSILQDATPCEVSPLDEAMIEALWPERQLEERVDGQVFSFFVPDGPHNRHVVLRAKEAVAARRHGAMLRSGSGMNLDDRTLCATLWMHGVFAAQLTIGNTSFHKLFSVSRDPYNITRASGLRILVDDGRGWRLLGVPSAFEMGLSDARWIYRLREQTITVRALASGEDPAMLWEVSVDGPPSRFLVFGHVVMGEREYEATGIVDIDPERKRITLRPGPDWLWGKAYPQARYHLVTSRPDIVDAVGGDEMLYLDGQAHGGPAIALRSAPTHAFSFAVVGSMTDATEAERLAERFSNGVAGEVLKASSDRYWSSVTRNVRIAGRIPDREAHDALLPWLAHDAMIHLTVPHGLEQYTGAAWGTRDVCQGPVEFLLALNHDDVVRDILRLVFAEQYEEKGDWPQWFMLPPYSQIRAGSSHGDVIVWPLKALCDYIEATGDFAFLDEQAPWRRDKDLAPSEATVTIAAHVEKLIATVESRFIPGTRLIRYGEGDWNDSLQPVDPHWPDWMVSSWTVALLYEQIARYATILEQCGKLPRASELKLLTAEIKEDFSRHLVRDGVVAGYGLFDSTGSGKAELLLHPGDRRTGIRYSLIAMTQPILAGLFSPTEARHHLHLIQRDLAFADGAHLMDRPLPYHGGIETLFRRAESAAFFGREIGLMYVHAHLRYCEALAMLGDPDDFWNALALVSPIAVTDRLGIATPRQRNAYFSSSDAAFADRYEADAEWDRVKAGTMPVDGGWRVYSSGPGLFMRALLSIGLGQRRRFGKRIGSP
jgi:1,2-beta-oligoglucan phosphorylase